MPTYYRHKTDTGIHRYFICYHFAHPMRPGDKRPSDQRVVVGRFAGMIGSQREGAVFVPQGVHVVMEHRDFSANYEQINDLAAEMIASSVPAPASETVIEITEATGRISIREPMHYPTMLFTRIVMRFGGTFDPMGIAVFQSRSDAEACRDHLVEAWAQNLANRKERHG